MRLLSIISLFFPLSSLLLVHADEIIWYYDFEEPPPGWGYYGFVFEGGAAHLYRLQYWYPGTSTAKSECASMVTEIVYIPIDMDSLVIDIPQYLDLWASASGSAIASVKLEIEINGSETQLLWDQHVSVYGTSEQIIDSLPIHICLTDLNPGSFISFRLWAYHGGFNGTTEIDWWLWEAQLTAYGGLALTPDTWAGIKYSLGWE